MKVKRWLFFETVTSGISEFLMLISAGAFIAAFIERSANGWIGFLTFVFLLLSVILRYAVLEIRTFRNKEKFK